MICIQPKEGTIEPKKVWGTRWNFGYAPLALFTGVILIVACSSDTGGTEPAQLVPTTKFIPLLVDLKILEEHYHHTYLRPELYVKSLDSSSAFVFEEYGVTKDQFRNSMNFYCQQPDTIYHIFESALDTINLRVSSRM